MVGNGIDYYKGNEKIQKMKGYVQRDCKAGMISETQLQIKQNLVF